MLNRRKALKSGNLKCCIGNKNYEVGNYPVNIRHMSFSVKVDKERCKLQDTNGKALKID